MRGQPHARAIGAAAVVRIAVGRSRGPGGLDQFRDRQARAEDCRLERGHFGIRRGGAGRNRVHPDQRFGRDFGAHVTHLGTHIAVAQLEPSAREGIVELRRVGEEAFGNLAIFRVHLQRHVGGGHHRRHALAGVARIGCHVFGIGVDRRPLLRAGRAVHQLEVILEQDAEVVVAPRGRIVRPAAFDPRGGDVASGDFFAVGQPAEALQFERLAFGRTAEGAGRSRAVGLAEGVAASGERNGFLVVHRHPRERLTHVTRALERIGVAARSFGIDVDQPHLDRSERVFDFGPVSWADAGGNAFVDPLLLGAPVDAFGLEHVGTAAAEAEHRPAHAFNRDIAGEDEQVSPADVLAVFLLDRPQQAACLVEVAVIGPGIERSEALLPGIGPAASVAGAIGARRVPRHADEERAVMPIVRRPPGLAVGHQRGQLSLQRGIIERVERFGIVEIFAVRVRALAAFLEDVELHRLGPPVAVGAAQQASRFAGAVERATAHLASFSVHDRSLLACDCVRLASWTQSMERQ